MTRSYPWRSAEVSWILAGACGALLVSLFYPLAAFKWGPFALPGLLVAAALAVITMSRPEIGVAVAFVLAPLANFGLLGLGFLNIPGWITQAIWLTFVLIVAALRSRGRVEAFPRMGGALVAYLAITFFAFGIASSQTDALPLLRAAAMGTVFFFAIALAIRDRNQVMWAIGGLAVTAILVGGLAAREYWSGATTGQGFYSNGHLVGRAAAGFGHPNELGAFLLMLIPFLLAAVLIQRRGRSFYLLGLFLAVVGVYASFSRGALLGLVAIPIVFMPRRYLGFLVPAFVVILLLATPSLVKERFSGLSSGQGSDVATRKDIWQAGLDIWSEQPYTGVGLGGFPTAYAEARLPGKRFLPNTVFQPPPDAHNIFLQALAETGLLGLIALLVLLFQAFRTSMIGRRAGPRWLRLVATAAVASVVALTIHGLVDFVLQEQIEIYFFGLLGLLASLVRISESGSSTSSPPRTPSWHGSALSPDSPSA